MSRPDLRIVARLNVGTSIGQCRAVPVNLGPGRPRPILAAYAADFDVDPYVDMFFFPTDTLKLILFTTGGEVLWKRDLGKGVVPGMWFCPVLAFDLDGDGVDEIYFVNNRDAAHPLALRHYCLEKVDVRTGSCAGQRDWPIDNGYDLALGKAFRYFIVGGHVGGEPVLVMATGTYARLCLRGYRPDMSLRWETLIADDAPGARGSHMCPVVDIDGDGSDELMWGERCIRLDDGREMFCCDRDSYRGHSDVVQPVWDRDAGRWLLYTCRESDPAASPRVVTFDAQGRRLWGHVDSGHIDMGWVARLGDDGRQIASAIRIDQKSCGPDGRHHSGVQEFAFDVLTGRPVEPGFSTYGTLPVDLNGDGLHELVVGRASRGGTVLGRHGEVLGQLGGPVALASKFIDHPGEQLLSYHADGTLAIWADLSAEDTPEAAARYASRFYRANQRLTAVGYNRVNLGGI